VVALLGGGKLWITPLDEPSAALIVPVGAGLSGVELSPDGRWAAGNSWHGSGLRVWDAQDGQQVAHLMPENTTVNGCFSPDGAVLATSSNADLRLWRAGRWDQVLRIPRRRPYSGGGEAIAFTPDGARLAAVDLHGTITFYDPRTGERRDSLEPPSPQPLGGLSFARDGSLLAAACVSNRIQVWDLEELSRQLDALRLGDR
jgi:WD40 repeat protein